MADDEFEKLSNDRLDEIMDFEAGQKKLESLKRMRARVNWEIKEERESFYWQLCRLINDWKSRLPDLPEIFQREEIDWLLTRCVHIGPAELIKFVIRTGYRDEPYLDEDGKPLLRRNTPVLHAAGHKIRDWESKVRELFKIYNKFNVNYTSPSGFTHFHAACMCGCDDVVEKFLELGQDPNCIVKKIDVSALHLALHQKHREVVQLLLRSHANPNWANMNGLTPLHIICRGGNDDDWFEEFFKITNEIQQTVQVEARDILGRTPLHWAVHYRHMKLVDLLLRRGADVNSKDASGHSCLHFIADKGDAHDVTEKFFEICNDMQLTVQINTLDNSGRAPLHMALSNGKQKMVECLLRNGADPNLANSVGRTPLHFIALRGIDDLGKKFFEVCNDMQLKAQVNAQENHGRTPLHLALSNGKQEMVECLLRNGADPNIADEQRYTCLHFIALHGIDDDLTDKFFEICNDMQLKVQIDALDKLGRTPLQTAVGSYKEHVVESLLRNGANPNIADAEELTSLHAICATDYDDDLAEKFLQICDEMELKMQVDAESKSGWTPLYLALLKGKKKVTEWLLRNGADQNLVNKKGSAPLHAICCREIDDDFVKWFFEVCDDMNLTVQVDPTNLGLPPLHLALYTGKPKMVEALLRRGANITLVDKDGTTALHSLCVRKYDDDLVKTFFKINDDLQQTVQIIDARDKWGRTPLQTAVANLLPNVIDVLLDRGADLSSFVLPTESYFCERFDRYKGVWDKLRLASGILVIVERLEDRGYDLSRSDVLTIIKLFVQYESFEKSSDLLEKCWRDDEEFTSKAIEISIIPNCLSLFDLLLLRPDEAAQLLTYTNYFEIERLNNLDKIPEQYRDKCLRYLCEKMSRSYFKRLALDAFQELIHYRLPILGSDMVIENLKNEDLFRIYEAGEIVAKENKAKLSDTVDKGPPVEQKVQIIKRQRS